MKILNKVNPEVTRRSFLGAMAAIGATASFYGCSSGSGETEYVYIDGESGEPITPDTTAGIYHYGSSGHNCGGRCVTRGEVSNGKILRFLTDENQYTSDGTYIDPESRNFPQTRSCARCRGYKYRLYHPGRLKYPLKQTSKRGDLSGFIRISWDQAAKEIATKHKAVLDEYGADGIYSIYAWGAATGQYQGASGGPLGAGGAGGAGGAALRYMGGTQGSYFGSYSTHQYRYFGVSYTGADEQVNANAVANYSKNVVLWGDNKLSTSNPTSYGYIKAMEDMKKRDANAKVYFIGPEFSDGAVTMADEWIVSKPYTDPALVAGMIYHMLDNTFDLTTGDVKQNAWLDVDYLDTLVYGFFDSPQYGLTEATGDIDATSAYAGDRVVGAVEAGKSYVSWILGNNDNAPTYSAGTTTSYTAQQFSGTDTKRWAPCSITATAGTGTQYKTKQNYQTAKTPAWASGITGVPEQTIKDLAQLYAQGGPIAATWSGGQQKQADGIANLYAVQALHIVTKNVGTYGAGFLWTISASVVADAGALNPSPTRTYDLGNGTIPNMKKAEASCTAWHTAIKMAYMDELKSTSGGKQGYTAQYIPNWDITNAQTGDGDIYWDDGGTKTFVQWRRNADGTIKIYQDDQGNEFYDWEGRTGTSGASDAHDGTPVMSGIRLLYNTGGNIFINQHENSNDSREMLECLTLNDYSEPNTFCLVSFDNFMSPTPRWSDYVLPAATSWEQQDIMAPTMGSRFYVPQLTTPPGESKPTWDFAIALLKAYGKLDPDAADAVYDFTGGLAGKTINSVEKIVKTAFLSASTTITSPYYGKKWDQFLLDPYLPAKPDDDTVSKPTNLSLIDAYKRLDASGKMNAFVTSTNKVTTNEVVGSVGGYGNEFYNTDDAPVASFRFQVYSRVLTWQYENRFSKYHGWLWNKGTAQSLVGQKHTDLEGDRFVQEIPLYYAYEDYYMEAYGYNTQAGLGGLNFLLTTTHDRYRSHSSMSENPMMRELTHRVPGRDANGKYKQGNDYGDYAMGPDKAFAVNGGGTFPPLNRRINADGTVDSQYKDIASYSEIWMNKSDGTAMGLLDGDLVQVENPIGAVRCVTRLTNRCAKGFVGLHQGCWYDPREIGGSTVDVGGNCNTLMASQPSRIDHGNGQQSAMVKITKVTE